MLVNPNPIKLTCRQSVTSLSDSFGERIQANYSILSADFSPKDLLFLLAGTPDTPFAPGAVTNVAIDSHIENRQNILLDVVNNIVNRVLLEDRSTLTYQDHVYIDMALHKLGIENVSAFMKQVRTLREENLSVFRLLSLYRDHFDTLTTTLQAQAGQKGAAGSGETVWETREHEREQGLYIHNEIYRRLGIAEIYNAFSNYMGNLTEQYERLDQRELITAEQSRVASLLTLNEYRQQTLQTDNLALVHHQNHYEMGSLLDPPGSEAEVMAQASASALLSVIDNVMLTRIQRYLGKQDFWADIRMAVSQSAENSLSRFISYHSDRAAGLTQNYYNAQQMTALFSTEAGVIAKFLTQISRDDSRTAIYGAPTGYPPRAQINYLEQNEWQEGPSDIEPESVLQALMNITRAQNSLAHYRQDILGGPELTNEFVRSTLAQFDSFTAGARHYHGDSIQAAAAQSADVTERTEVFHAEMSGGDEGDAHTPPPGAALAPDSSTVRRVLDEVNRKNLEKYEQLIQHKTEKSEQLISPTPDKKRIFRDALRAIEAPEAVIGEAIQSAQEMAHPEPPEVAAALAQADETTRRIYEAVREYQRNPEAATASGIIRAASPSALNAEVAQTIREQVALEHSAQRITVEDQLIHTAAETVLERIVEHPSTHSAVLGAGPDAGWRSPVSIVHRQAENQVSEELLSRLDRQRVEQTTVEERRETVAESTTQQTQINQFTQEFTSKTAEDVTELINRTLARQIGTISDRVYSQLERRLQTERARRGRS